MKKILSIFILIVSFVLVGCVNNAKEKDETEAVKTTKKVAIYDMGILDIMDHAGFENFEISSLSIPEYLTKGELKKYANYGGPDLGNHREPTIEPLKLLQPDIIILTSRFENLEGKIKKEFPNVIVYQAAIDPTKYEEGLKNNFNFLEETFPKAKERLEASKIELLKEINDFKELTKNNSGKALTLMPNGKSIATYGSGGRFDMIHSTFGFKDALIDVNEKVKIQATSTQTHGNNINFEFFTKVNPDIVFFIDRNVSSGDGTPSESITDLMNSNAFKNTNAYKNNMIVSLDSNAFYILPGGYSTTKKMMEGLEKAIK